MSVYNNAMEERKYLSVSETARKWNLSDRRVRALCESGKIEGAFMIGRTWNVPVEAKKPKRS